MSREEWQQLEEVLDVALELPGEDRAAFVEEACGTDLLLRRRARRMLGAAGRAGQFLERPVDACAAGLLREVAREAEDVAATAAAGRRVAAGRRLGPYRVIRELGRGGMGAVYLAERDDEQYHRRVALKVVPPGPPGGALGTRFPLERRILASLEHPNIARLYDAGVGEDGTPYLAMEYVDGRPIDAYCDERRLPVRARLELFEQVCEAVQFAHRKLVVHRDLKPGNILVTDDGVVKLLDFGIAKLLRGDDGGGTAATGGRGFRALTPRYASPEQLRGEPISTATDVYALGVLLFELLAGSWPYRTDGRSLVTMERAVLEQEPGRPSAAVAPSTKEGEGSRGDEAAPTASRRRSTSPSALRRELRGDLDEIVLTALRKEPERRYASVGDLRDDLRAHRERRPVSARPATWRYRAGKFVHRHRAGVAAAGLIGASLIAGTAGTAWQARAAQREARRADHVRRFLVELFEVSDPDRARGVDVTARALLDRGAARLDAELADEPEMRAEMLAVLGGIYQRLGHYDRARPLLEEALDARDALVGPRHPDAAESAADLASLLYEQGEYGRAETLARRALAIRRETRGREDTLVAASMTDLAAILDGRGEHEEAERLYREALATDRELGARGAVATDLSSLSVALWRRGEYDEALPLAEEALALRRELYGDEHTRVATDLLNLATILMASGDYGRSEELLRECLALRRKLLGDGHPHVAVTLNNLGQLLRTVGRLEEAEAAHREALGIRRDVFGDDHLEVAASMNNLGTVSYFRGDPGGAAQQFERALAIWRDELGETHPTVLTGLNNLGAARREQGDLAGAERALRQVAALRRKALGDEHPDVAQSLNNLALVLASRGEHAEAESLFRAALATWRKALGDEHPTVAHALVGLGRLMRDAGRCGDAVPLLREAVDIRLASLEEGSALVAGARLDLGGCLLELGRVPEAAPLLRASYAALREARGEEHETTRRARDALAELERGRGRSPKSPGASR